MKLSTLSFCIFLIQHITFAQNYAISEIPDSLKTDAFVVVRNDIKEVSLTEVNKGVTKRKIAYTILNKVGEEQAYFVAFYDKETSVTVNSITMYDKFGEKIRKIKSNEIIDIPAYSGALFADDRVKAYKTDYAQIPYTIEYDYEVSSTNMISQGVWSPYSQYNQSVQNSIFKIIFPPSITLNKKELGLNISESINIEGKKIWECQTHNLKAVIGEPYSTSFQERVPRVYFMSSVIKWDNHVGSSNTWNEYGKWAFELYDGRNELCEAEKIKVSELLKNTPDTLEQIKKLYTYMQDRTRYVGIQIGIGGFQPFDAKTVYETGYGDCKALTNYMYSLLKYAGIKSHPALVGSGNYIEPILLDFPNFHQFNHVILAVPYKSDTIWLESTSQIIPFGFLGDFTDDRDVLLLTKDGGKFAHTTKYNANHNTKTSNIKIVIDTLGNANCKIATTYSALQYDKITNLFILNADEQKKWLYEDCDFPSPQINTFSITQNKKMIPDAIVTQELASKNYATFSGNYMVVPLNIASKMNPITKMINVRQSQVVISRDNSYKDSITIELPKSYRIGSLPQEKKLDSKFGSYSYTLNAKDNIITYVRNLTTYKGKHPAGEYKEFYDAILAISKADGLKIMVTK